MKQFITNRHTQKIVMLVEISSPQKGLAFVMHGLSGFKEQIHIQAFAEAFLESGFSVIRFDTTNTFGESEGKYEDATLTNDYEDLEDVIAWARTQSWYQEPFWLCGHSLGGMSTALYAEKYPARVKGLAPISTVVSGKLSCESRTSRNQLAEWKRTGWLVEPRLSKPGEVKRLKWSHMEDRLQYDLLPNVSTLIMPVLMAVGDLDASTPLEHQKILFEKLPGPKEIHVIKGAEHTFRKPEHLAEIKTILKKWIHRYNHQL